MSLEEFPPSVRYDLDHFLLDKLLSKGSCREVYLHSLDDSLVVKVEKESSFQNVTEWTVWKEVEKTKWAKWFAPCLGISKNGRILIQKRAIPIIPEKINEIYGNPNKFIIPKKIPSFFTDLKPSNFGFIDGKFVCIDYGLNLLITKGLTNAMKKNPLVNLDNTDGLDHNCST